MPRPDPQRTTVLPSRRLVTLALAAVLCACTDAPTATLDDPRADTTPAPEVAPAPDDEPAQPTTPAAEVCDDERRATLVAAVDGQLAAIARADWASAITFATPGFRAGIDAARFEEIITDGFPVVADNRARDVGRCRTRGDEATLEVTVEDGDGTQQLLLYIFERGPEGWGIGGAAPAAPGRPSPDDPGLTV